jgi:hypothetical protein
MVEVGSKWKSSDRDTFIVINTVELNGKNWVHYRLENSSDSKEYSCYEESFVARFVQFKNHSYRK